MSGIKIIAKQWVDGINGQSITLGSITSYKEKTLANKFRLRRLLYKKYPSLHYFVLHD